VISSLIDAVLLSALAATSICVILMYRRLQRFDALQSEAAKAFVRSSQALENARAALEALHEHSGEMAVSLAARLNEARLVLNEIDDRLEKRADKARREEAEFDRQRAARASTPPSMPEPDLAFLKEWTDRFSGLAARGSARHGSFAPHGGDVVTHTIDPGAAAVIDAAPLPPAQTLALTWRALAQAAQRAV